MSLVSICAGRPAPFVPHPASQRASEDGRNQGRDRERVRQKRSSQKIGFARSPSLLIHSTHPSLRWPTERTDLVCFDATCKSSIRTGNGPTAFFLRRCWTVINPRIWGISAILGLNRSRSSVLIPRATADQLISNTERNGSDFGARAH